MSYEKKLETILEALEVEDVSGFMKNAEIKDYQFMGTMIAQACKSQSGNFYNSLLLLQSKVLNSEELTDQQKTGTKLKIEILLNDLLVKNIIKSNTAME